jgi:hypothetical protein
MKAPKENLEISGRTNFLLAVTEHKITKHFFGLFTNESQKLRVIDKEGTIRLQLNDCLVGSVKTTEVKGQIKEMIEKLTTFGDAGALLPDIFLLVSAKIVDLTGLIEESQIMSLIDIELSDINPNEEIVVIASPKQ